MYKSRVETFNQVHYFHHPILLLFILQDDDKKKTNRSTSFESLNRSTEVERKRQNIFCVCLWRWQLHRWQVRWVCLIGGWFVYDMHLPFVSRFLQHGIIRGKKKQCCSLIEEHKTQKAKQRHCHCVTGMVWQLFDLHCHLNVGPKWCVTLEWSELSSESF